MLVQVAPDRRHDARAEEEELARLLVHQQVEVALAVAGLLVGEAVEGVWQRASVASEDGQLFDGQGRLAAPRLRGPADDPDHVPEMDVDRTGLGRVAHELDAARAVDEVEEDELAHLAARHDAAGQAAGVLSLLARLERIGLRADGCHFVPVGKALGSCHGRASLVRVLEVGRAPRR